MYRPAGAVEGPESEERHAVVVRARVGETTWEAPVVPA